MKAGVDFVRADGDDVLAAAMDAIASSGLAAVLPALDRLRQAGIAPDGPDAQPVLIEALFQMLEVLEQDPCSALVAATVAALDFATARTAATLLRLANFPDDSGSALDLDDSALLLIAALGAAAGGRAEADALLLRAEHMRFNDRFRRAALVLRCRLMESPDAVVDALVIKVMDCLDHPELWAMLPDIVAARPDIHDAFDRRMGMEIVFRLHVTVLRELCRAAAGAPEEALRRLEPLAIDHSLVTLVQGAIFHVKSLLDPGNPMYDLGGRFCRTPFEVLDVLDGTSHLCCANWVLPSAGNLAEESWENVWNSDTAQSIRASIHDGSFRYCNKIACPAIGGNLLPAKAEVAAASNDWREIVETERTAMVKGPYRVNLAYDNTCNLSCPSCRKEKIAADAVKRARFDALQEQAILPLLRETRLVFITGAGDPFASKNFRKLMERLGPEDYPDLKFQIMTNGMLFTRREWDRFPALHGRVAFLRISIDAATGPTHELLRRGARWPVMQDNLAFVSELRAAGKIDRVDLTFVVQRDNFREMGDAVDLARHYGADRIGFFRLTNWGTFTNAEYAERAVFMPSHPLHGEFLRAMRDPRLRDPLAALGELQPFAELQPA